MAKKTKKVAKKVTKKATKKVTAKAKKVVTKAKKTVKKVAAVDKEVVPKKKKAKKKTKAVLKLEAESAELQRKWMAIYRKHSKGPSRAYNMSESFEPKTPIEHKIHGWGFVLKNINDRLEILFESGIKVLISNYKR